MKENLPIYHLMDILYAYKCSFYSKSISNIFKEILEIYLPNAVINSFNIAESERNISYIFIDSQDINMVEDLSKLIFVQKIPMYSKDLSYNFIVILKPKNLSKVNTKLVLDYIYNLVDAIIKNLVGDLSIDLNEKPLIDYLNNKRDKPPLLYDIIYIIIKIYMMTSLVSHIKDIYADMVREIVLEKYLKLNKISSKRIIDLISDNEFIDDLISNPLTTILYIIEKR